MTALPTLSQQAVTKSLTFTPSGREAPLTMYFWDGHVTMHACACRQVLNMRGENEWSQHVAETAAETGLSGANGLFEVAAKSYRLRRSQSSMDDGDSGSDDEFSSGSNSNSNGRGRGGTQLIRTRSILSRISAGDRSSDSGSDEDAGPGTQVIRGRSVRRRNGASRAVAAQGSDSSRSVDEGGEGSAGGRGMGRVPAKKLKESAPTAEGRLRDEVDSW